MADAVGGGDVESREKARRRGRAYQCLHCFHKQGKQVVDVKGRVEDHILREHLSFQQVPFYCSLCYFRCLKWDQLINHVTGYKRHVSVASKAGIVDNSKFLIQNQTPYKIGPMDMHVFSAEDSVDHFLKVSTAAEASRKDMSLAVQACLPEGFLESNSVSNTQIYGPTVTPVYNPTPIPVLNNTKSCTVTSDQTTCDTSNFFEEQCLSAEGCELKDKSYNEPKISEISTPLSKIESSIACAPMSGSSTSSCISTPRISVTSGIDREMTPPPITNNVNQRLENNEPVNVISISEEGSVVVRRKDQSGEIMENIVMNKVKRKAEKRPSEIESEDPLGDIKKAKPTGQEVAEFSLIDAMIKLTDAVNKSSSQMKRMEELIIDNTCMMAKMTDTMTRLQWGMEAREKNEERREGKRQEYEERRDEERKREVMRERKEENHRREAEKERRDEERRREEERRRVEERRRDEERRRENRRENKENHKESREKTESYRDNRKFGDRRN